MEDKALGPRPQRKTGSVILGRRAGVVLCTLERVGPGSVVLRSILGCPGCQEGGSLGRTRVKAGGPYPEVVMGLSLPAASSVCFSSQQVEAPRTLR